MSSSYFGEDDTWSPTASHDDWEASSTPPPLEEAEKNAVRHDRWDIKSWASTRADAPSLERAVKEFGKEHDYAEDFMSDLFYLTYKADPRLVDIREMLKPWRPNHTMAALLQGYEELRDLRQFTVGDECASSLCMLSMLDAVKAAYDAAHALHEALAAAQGEGQGAQGAAQGEGQGEGQGAQGAAQGAAQDAAEERAKEAMDALAEAMKAAAQEEEEFRTLAKSFGVGPGELKRMPVQERFTLAKRLRSSRLAKFSALLGSFRTLAQVESRRKVKHDPDESLDVKLGDDVTRLLASEQVALAAPELDPDFWKRWADRELLTVDKSHNMKGGLGPVIVVCDESSSMDYSSDGAVTAEAWSKALTLALAEEARRSRREFYYIGFSSAHQMFEVDLSTPDISKALSMTEHFFSGGTVPQPALTRAQELCSERTWRGSPDIVFITDGEFAVDSSFREEWSRFLEDTGTRVFGIFIGDEGDHHGDHHDLTALSTNVRTITGITNGVEVADLFRTIQ